MIVSIRNALPSCVRSATKSYAQTWFGCSGRNRIQDPSFIHRRSRFGCRAGTLSPSLRQIRSTRFLLTPQPASRRRPVTRLYPYLPYCAASPTIACVSASSSDLTTATCRWVERYCPSTLQARRSETPSPSHTALTQARRREGLRSFPWPPPEGSSCPTSGPRPPSGDVRSPSPAP
jgi:hypothetical protein